MIEEEIGVRAMTEEKEEDLVLKRRKTGKRIGGLSQEVSLEIGDLEVREERRRESTKK